MGKLGSGLPQDREELQALELLSKFHIRDVLGKGAFATVYRAQYRQHHQQQSIHTCTQIDPKNTKNAEIALKIINLDKISTRWKMNGRASGLLNGATNASSSSDLEDDDDDTEQLFFPSRIGKKALQENECDGVEIALLKKTVQMEINVHTYSSKLRHPNIASLLESFYYSLPGKNRIVAALAIEYCPLGDLHSYIKRRRDERGKKPGSTLLEENEVRYAMRHILRGLAFLHSHGISHRDIKPGNILLAPRDVSGIYKKMEISH